MANEQRYSIDLDWVWGENNPNLDAAATLLATITDPTPGLAEQKIQAWFDSFDKKEDGYYVCGGWAVTKLSQSEHSVTLELVSGGQDVAESLGHAVELLQDAVLSGDTSIEWAPQPIVR